MILAEAAFPCKPFVSIHPGDVDYTAPWLYAKDFELVDLHDFKALSRLITKAVWSDCVWDHGKRNEDKFRASFLCVIDVDNGRSLDQTVNELCDTRHIIATTKSHGIKGDRFRVVLPWSSRITDLDLYRYNLERAVLRFDGDTACVDAARFYWPCKELISYSDEGYEEQVLPLPIGYQSKLDRQLDAVARHTSAPGVFPAWVLDALNNGVREGFRNNNVYEIAKCLAYHGLCESETIDLLLRSAIRLPQKELENAVRSGRRKAEKLLEEKRRREREGTDGGPLPGDSRGNEPGV